MEILKRIGLVILFLFSELWRVIKDRWGSLLTYVVLFGLLFASNYSRAVRYVLYGLGGLAIALWVIFMVVVAIDWLVTAWRRAGLEK